MIPAKYKSDQQVFQDAWVAAHQHEWLFPQNFDLPNDAEGPGHSEEYINAFMRMNRLFMFRCPTPYSFKLIEKLKDKVAFSSHAAAANGVVPYSIFQLDGKRTHMIADWLWHNEQKNFIYSATMFVNNQLDYPKFLKENREFEVEMKETTMGFGNSRVNE